MYLIFNTHEKAKQALDKINESFGFPAGKTGTWAIIDKAHEQDLWFFIAPEQKYLYDVFFDSVEEDISKYLDKSKFIDLNSKNHDGTKSID